MQNSTLLKSSQNLNQIPSAIAKRLTFNRTGWVQENFKPSKRWDVMTAANNTKGYDQTMCFFAEIYIKWKTSGKIWCG